VTGTISVIASGWSLASIDRDRIPGLRIGVNDSAWRAPVDLGVTMDRLFFEGRHRELLEAFPSSSHRCLYYRAGIDKLGDAPAHWIRFANDHTSSDMSRAWAPRCTLNGTNSGICGINLAFRQDPERVILWGFDMCRSPAGEPYYHPPYPWAPGGATKAGKYQEWALQFATIAKQFDAAGIELLNASPASAIKSIKKVDPKKVLT
jgi:hypothetical protein